MNGVPGNPARIWRSEECDRVRGFALIPGYIKNFLPWSVVSRPLKGKAPTIDLVVGYHKANTSPILAKFISRLDDLIERATKHMPR